MLMFSTTTSPGSAAASWLNRRSCRSQTGVSSDGVTLMTFIFPAKSSRRHFIEVAVQHRKIRRLAADCDIRADQGQGLSLHGYYVFSFIIVTS